MASKPIAGALSIGWSAALLKVTSSTTGRVMSLMVSSPVTLSLPSPAGSTLVLLNFAVGYFSASKKSALRRCSLNLLLKASRPDSGKVTSTLEADTLSASYTRVPWTSPKLANGCEKPKWLHCASTLVWVGSRL